MNNAQSVSHSVATTSNHVEFSTFIPLKFVRRGGRSVVEPPENVAQVIKDHAQLPDTKLVEGLTRAFYWQRLIDEGIVRSGVEIARQEGLDQATVNECMRLKALIDKGLVKVHNFSQSKNKFGYIYVLTPQGIAEKALLAGRFLKRKMTEYDQLQAEIEALKAEMACSDTDGQRVQNA